MYKVPYYGYRLDVAAGPRDGAAKEHCTVVEHFRGIVGGRRSVGPREGANNILLVLLCAPQLNFHPVAILALTLAQRYNLACMKLRRQVTIRAVQVIYHHTPLHIPS